MAEWSKPIQEKQHRLPRSSYVGEAIVSFTARIADRRHIFTETGIVNECLAMLQDAADPQSCVVPVYCFMPEHVHVVLQGLSPASDVWRSFVGFKQRTGYWFKKERIGCRWQKDFHDHIIRPGEDWPAHVRYIAANPVRAGLVERWDLYPYTGSIGYDLDALLMEAM
ncbi:MAG TPA: transposase [Rhodothermales bacterium]|nr:transposase [Rhodothermales bacterium]